MTRPASPPAASGQGRPECAGIAGPGRGPSVNPPAAAPRRAMLLALSVLLGAVCAVAAVAPATADPPHPNAVPDPGSRPTPADALQLPADTTAMVPPGSPPAGTPTLTGPLAAQIYAQEAEVALLGDQVVKLREQQAQLGDEKAAADHALQQARATLAAATSSIDLAADAAWKHAAQMPPALFRSDLHALADLAQLHRGTHPRTGQGEAVEVAAATEAVAAAEAAVSRAATAVDTVAGQAGTLTATHTQRVTALLALKQRHTGQLIEIERQREAADARIGATVVGGATGSGKAAHPRALAAVRFALAQLGKPYLWAAEGPDRYDCSGLTWAAYRSKGADYTLLPRVSRDQYTATRVRTVAPAALLPGDLVFFASGTTWNTIHHMGMYIGNGKMVHSPTTGDVVKVSTVWWSRFFAATRVIGAVPAPSPTPRPRPAPSSSPPEPSPSASVAPTPTPSTSPPVPPSTPTATATADVPPPTSSPSEPDG